MNTNTNNCSRNKNIEYTNDIFEQNIPTPMYYTNYNNFDMMTKKYLESKRNYNFHIPYIPSNTIANNTIPNNNIAYIYDKVGQYPFNSDGLNTTHNLFQKENKLHDARDRVFNSCVYTNTESGNIGCSNMSNDLNKEYFIKNQKMHKNVINYLNKDTRFIGNNFNKYSN